MTQSGTPQIPATPLGNDSGHSRIHERLVEYWQELCAGRAFPKESDIDPSEISNIWDACFLVQFAKGRQDYKYSYLGISLIEAWGDSPASSGVSEHLIDPASASLIHKFKEVVDSGRPVIDESEFVNRKNVRIKYRACMLPLGDAPDQVKYILGGMKWKAY